MATSLFDLSVGSYLQGLSGVAAVLEKGLAHFAATGADPDSLVHACFWEDMRPLQFQVQSVAHHSLGAIEGLRRGEFSPPPPIEPQTYARLQQMVADAAAALKAVSSAEVDAYEGRDMWFRAGERQIPFTAEGFILSFSLPNFYFHATTTYDLLRSKGVPLVKRDYLGRLRLKT